MILTVKTLFLLAAAVCFLLATFAVKGPPGGWTPLGLFFVVAFLWP